MTMNSDIIYPLYRDYIARLDDALSRPPAGPVADAYRVKQLSRSEFEAVWQAWGRFPGLQDKWAGRFAAGYDTDSEAISQWFEAALARKTIGRQVA